LKKLYQKTTALRCRCSRLCRKFTFPRLNLPARDTPAWGYQRQMPGIDKENLANTRQTIYVTQASLFSWKNQENNLREVLLHQYCAGMCKTPEIK
jgi:hypothetical protein